MPIGSAVLVLLGLTLYIQNLSAHSDDRPSILSELFLDDSYMPTAKRTYDAQQAAVTESFECCPSVTRGIAPLGGLSRDGSLLQLFRDSNTIQKFYETTCAPGIHNNSCKFINSSFSSHCVQKYTYTYAIVKDFNVTQPYRFDLMKIKSGCSCIVDVPIPEQEMINVEKRLIDELTEEILLNV